MNLTAVVRQRSRSATTFAGDGAEREHTDNVHPVDWRNLSLASDYDLVIVGGGTAGLTAAKAAASRGAKTALVERHLLGGTWLNIECVPSKAILRTSRLYAEMHDADRYGACIPRDVRVDFAAVMQRVRGVRARISRADSARGLTAAGIDVCFVRARSKSAPELDRLQSRTQPVTA